MSPPNDEPHAPTSWPPNPSRRTVLTWLAALPLAPALGACGDDVRAGGDATSARDATAPHDADARDGASATTDARLDATPATDIDAAPETCAPTSPDAQGPFFEPDAPAVTELAPDGEPGDALRMSGRVVDGACRPIAGAQVEVWQADADGDYHEDKLRATLTADDEGRWAFRSVVPGRYFQASGFRPAHLHFRVTADGFADVVTQVYFEGDPFLSPEDSCGSCGSDDPDRIVALEPGREGDQVATWEAVLRAR